MCTCRLEEAVARIQRDCRAAARPACIPSGPECRAWRRPVVCKSVQAFSCLDKANEFVRRAPGDKIQLVPRVVLNELLIFAALSPLLTAALGRQWCPTVVATDVAPEYGLGVSVADMPPETMAKLEL